MQPMTLEQLRTATDAGGIKSVTLKGLGGGFFIEIATRSGQNAILAKARSSEPRRFGNPASALLLLRGVGVGVAQIDATQWDPHQKDLRYRRDGRGQAAPEDPGAGLAPEPVMDALLAASDDCPLAGNEGAR